MVSARPRPLSPSSTVLGMGRAGTVVVAVLGSGLDPLATLAPGTRVLAARSFVGDHPLVDTVGSGTACADTLAESIAGRWTREGRSELHLVIAQVVDRTGRTRLEAIDEALAWVRTLTPVVDAVAVGWGPTDPQAVRGLARRLARLGVRLVAADQEVEDFAAAAAS